MHFYFYVVKMLFISQNGEARGSLTDVSWPATDVWDIYDAINIIRTHVYSIIPFTTIYYGKSAKKTEGWMAVWARQHEARHSNGSFSDGLMICEDKFHEWHPNHRNEHHLRTALPLRHLFWLKHSPECWQLFNTEDAYCTVKVQNKETWLVKDLKFREILSNMYTVVSYVYFCPKCTVA